MKTQHELIDAIPARNVEWFRDEKTEYIVLKRPKFYNEWAKKMFSPFIKSDYYSIKLDKIGTVVWQHCNGKNTVRDIGEILGKEFGPDIEPIYERLFKFIVQMHKGKLITLRKYD